MNRLKRLLYECTCGVVCKSLDEYAKHAEEEMVRDSPPPPFVPSYSDLSKPLSMEDEPQLR